MRAIFSFIFDFLTDPLGLPIHPLWEYLILFVIGIFAFQIAWNISPGGIFGSHIHWVVRLVAFVLMWLLVYLIIAICKWLFANWVIIVSILGGIVAVVFAIFLIQTLKKKGKAKNERNEK